MKVFLSHAISDQYLINHFKKSCTLNGLDLLIAEHTIDVSNTITQKIKELISASEIALFLLTRDGTNSKFVQQEIGFVESLSKPALFIVEKGQQKFITGFAYGKDFIELDVQKPNIAIEKAIARLIMHWQQLNAIKRKEKENAALLIAGLVGLYLISNTD